MTTKSCEERPEGFCEGKFVERAKPSERCSAMTTKIFEATMSEENRANGKSHIPKDSFLFEKVVPAALILMGIITLGLILFAAGVLLGIVQF